MDKDAVRKHNSINNNAGRSGERTGGGDGSLVLTASSDTIEHTTTSTFVLQWGNRKRLRCMKKVQAKDDSPGPVQRIPSRVFSSDKAKEASNNYTTNHTHTNHSNGHPNLRQRPSSPQQPRRTLGNAETSSSVMRGISNGGVRGMASPDKVGTHEKRGSNGNRNHQNNENNINKPAASSDTAPDRDCKKGGSSSGSGDAVSQVWPPKFVISLTNKEKEEDFLALKGSKLPQRPKKRAKFVQRTLNLVSPGAFLCDLTLERYEVREKKITKKRPRGLKAMSNMESDSE